MCDVKVKVLGGGEPLNPGDMALMLDRDGNCVKIYRIVAMDGRTRLWLLWEKK